MNPIQKKAITVIRTQKPASYIPKDFKPFSAENFVTDKSAYLYAKGQRAVLEAMQNMIETAKIDLHLMSGERILSKVKLYQKSTAQKVTAYLTEFKNKDTISLLIRNENGDEVLGSARLIKKNASSVYKTGQTSGEIEVERIDTVNKGKGLSDFKGIGTILMRAAKKISEREGFDGRLVLRACNEVSPTLFYYKLGLRFTSEEKNRLMEQFLKKTNAKKVPDKISCGIMYQPVVITN